MIKFEVEAPVIHVVGFWQMAKGEQKKFTERKKVEMGWFIF